MAKFTSIEKFVDEYGDDMLPVRSNSGKLFWPIMAEKVEVTLNSAMKFKPVPFTDAERDEYRDFKQYELLGAEIIEAVDVDDGHKCDSCDGGTVRVTLRKKTGEVVATYEVYTG